MIISTGFLHEIFADVVYCQHSGFLCAIWLQLPWGNDLFGVLWTEICHSPRRTHCSANHIQNQVWCSISHVCKAYLDALDMFHILNPTCRRTRSIYWHGVWTVVQLVYIMAVKTSASLLLCPTLSRKTLTGTSNVMVYNNEAVNIGMLTYFRMPCRFGSMMDQWGVTMVGIFFLLW